MLTDCPLKNQCIGIGDRLRRAMELIVERRNRDAVNALAAQQAKDDRRQRMRSRKAKNLTTSGEDEVGQQRFLHGIDDLAALRRLTPPTSDNH